MILDSSIENSDVNQPEFISTPRSRVEEHDSDSERCNVTPTLGINVLPASKILEKRRENSNEPRYNCSQFKGKPIGRL